MVQKARCKFTVTSVEGDDESDATVRLEAQYDPELTKEDEAFSKFTPWGTMEFGIANPELKGFFKEGQAYYVDLTPVEEGQ
jgi:hypothetical protein